MSDPHADEPEGPLDLLVYYGGAAALLSLFAVVFYSVGARYLFNRPPLWSVDVPNLIFIWLVFGAAGLTTKLGPQIRVVFFVDKMPHAVNLAILVLTHCAVLAMLGSFITYSLPIIALSRSETMLSTGWPGSVFYYALPVGCVIMGIYQLRALVLLLRGQA